MEELREFSDRRSSTTLSCSVKQWRLIADTGGLSMYAERVCGAGLEGSE